MTQETACDFARLARIIQESTRRTDVPPARSSGPRVIHRMRSFALILFFAASVPPARAAEVVFEKDVLPILQKRCFHCHGAETNKSDLDVRTLAGVLHGGKSGPAVSPGSPERSLLWIKVAGDEMPAEGDK